jgi:hypothetical protein
MSSGCGGRPGKPGLVAYMVNTRVSYKYTCPGCPDCDPCKECGGQGWIGCDDGHSRIACPTCKGTRGRKEGGE